MRTGKEVVEILQDSKFFSIFQVMLVVVTKRCSVIQLRRKSTLLITVVL